MVLKFVSGKPVKVQEYAKSLEEAMTPPDSAQIQPTHTQVQEHQPVEVEGQQNSGVQTEEANSEVLVQVDRYTEIQMKLDILDIESLLKEREELKKKLQSIAKSDHFADDQRVQLYGTHKNYVEFSAKASNTEIVDKPGMIKKMGIDQYMLMSTITLTNAKKVLSENELDLFTANVAGARTLKAVHPGE